jgi:hypothetical protein
MSMPSLSGNRKYSSAGSIPKGYAAGNIQQYNPQQMGLHNQQFGFLGPESQLYQQAQGNDAGFAQNEDYANRQFQEFSGQNASRFSGQGMGARRGSGFQNQQTQGAQDFASSLARQRQGLQRQALNDLMGMSSTILGQRPEEQFLVKKDMPFWQQLGLGAVGGLTSAAGSAFGGGIGKLFGGGQQQQQQQPQQQWQRTQF